MAQRRRPPPPLKDRIKARIDRLLTRAVLCAPLAAFVLAVYAAYRDARG